ncbi:MAG TPA: DNA cytosine methyltransferase [Albitalea sp.]|uniref:DNA cytosine methyltransferase n=1 Tax=Piscinibacter sp. TaxID=1903157 RepID=UPI002ED22D88
MSESLDLRTPDAAVEQLAPPADAAGVALVSLGPLWIVEEASGHLRPQNRLKQKPRLRLYKLDGEQLTTVAEQDLVKDDERADVVASLLAKAKAHSGVVVCSFRTVAVSKLLKKLEPRLMLHYVLELDSTLPVVFSRARQGHIARTPKERLKSATWADVTLSRASKTSCRAANLGEADVHGVPNLRCFALSIGGIDTYQRGVLIGATSLPSDLFSLQSMSQALAWTRWIRLAVRRASRSRPSATKAGSIPTPSNLLMPGVQLNLRPNRKLARTHDVKQAGQAAFLGETPPTLRGKLTASKNTLNVVELFAGAGGMGLGFLSASSQDGRGFRISSSAEIHPVYVHTLEHNHTYMVERGLCAADAIPSKCEPSDLCSDSVRRRIADQARKRGRVDVVIGGPPCQGFSSANRNSWSASNPNNKLVDAFLDSVQLLSPRVLLMENVQGILWTPREGAGEDLSVASHVLKRLDQMGYMVFPKMLDAVWYGVPQNRNRFFLLGIHKDVGYKREDFGQWGPFPRPTHGPGTKRPFVTVQDAIGDLPVIENGQLDEQLIYRPVARQLAQNAFLSQLRHGAPVDVIWDHVASRHAEYVIERYKAIPEGGNWEDVKHLMTNYADVSRTHSNIYRRLALGEPAITIGHYRKSMIVHPTQHRGLSLREAARLQSFPDWFRFAGSSNSVEGGLMHKQQQLANAVCPNVTKAVAEFILDL